MSFQAWNSSSSATLSAVMNEVGQLVIAICLRAQITSGVSDSVSFNHPHRRFLSKPLLRQVSHFHAAWLANWKWKATISFFFRLHLARIAP
jgi:hypothetical protein